MIPGNDLMAIQKAVLQKFFYVRTRIRAGYSFHSYHKKRSVITNAKYHAT